MEERKSRRGLWVVGSLLILGLVFAWGMVIGGGAVYAWLQLRGDREVQTFVRTIPEVGAWQRLEEGRQWLEPNGAGAAGVGAIVVEIVADGPADRAGLREGDIIVTVDGQQIGLGASLAELVAEYEPGDRLVLVVERPGAGEREITVRLAENPQRRGYAYLGLEYVPLDLSGGWQITEPRFYLNDGTWTREIPFGDSGFDLQDLPGDLRFYVVPGQRNNP
jgi:hypothetical protein